MTEDRCSLVGNDFGWIVQALLFLLSFSVLVLKKFCDRLKRTWCVWLMDSSKQILGSILLHFYNLFSAQLLQDNGDQNELDECQWYFATFMFDIILITFLSWILLQLIQCILRRTCPRYAFTSGSYYKEDSNQEQSSSNQAPTRNNESNQRKFPWKAWLYQLIIWFLILSVAKVLIVLLLWGLTDQVGWLIGEILSPITDQPKVELILVMIIIPTICNALQYWIVDSFIKKKKKKKRKVSEEEQSKDDTKNAERCNSEMQTEFSSQKVERLVLLENYS